MMIKFDAATFRQELMGLPVTPAWENLAPPKFTEIHVPLMHRKALSPEHSIVEGMRGAGKSFWTAALADDETRSFVSKTAIVPSIANVVVRIGFGLDVSNTDFPSRNLMDSLLNQGHKPDAVWRAVLLRHLFKYLDKALPFNEEWDDAIGWVESHPGETDKGLAECDRAFADQGKILLLLFDSLDRLADDWGRIRDILSAALKLCLECRSRRAIRFKFFLRHDMVEEEDEIWRFSDSSKLLHSKVQLEWRPNDLYGVILLHLANSSVGEAFRETLQRETNLQWQAIAGAYPLPRNLDEPTVRSVINALAWPWMGGSAKKGNTYTWIPAHLSDANGRLTIESISTVFKEAAEWTDMHIKTHDYAMHYEGIRRAVLKASAVRVAEIQRYYPMEADFLSKFKGLSVPLSFSELADRLPDDYRKLVDNLIKLGVIYRTTDNGIQMPDIFRVGFGLGRKGGVRPV